MISYCILSDCCTKTSGTLRVVCSFYRLDTGNF